jgi:hypothetical protein
MVGIALMNARSITQRRLSTTKAGHAGTVSFEQMPGGSFENLPTGASIAHDHTSAPNAVSSPSLGGSSESKFDPKRYRQAQTLQAEESGGWVRKQQTVIPVRKPTKKRFVRAHHSADYRADGMPTITDETNGEVYLLSADLVLPADLENKVDLLHLATAMTAEGSLFLWMFKNSTNSWSQSARIAINEASRRWVRVIADMSSNGYLLEFPMVAPEDPVCPL